MSLTLKDLRKVVDAPGANSVEMFVLMGLQKVTLSDLVEVLRAEGYVVRPPQSKTEAKRIATQQTHDVANVNRLGDTP